MAEVKPNTKERGQLKVVHNSRWLAEDNAALRYPRSVGVYSKMYQQDSQVVSVLRAMTLPILKAQWRIDPAGASDDVVEMVSNDLRLPVIGEDNTHPRGVRAGRVSWKYHLEKALSMLVFGHAYFEKVYEVREDGKTHLRKLAFRPQETISQIHVEDDGGLSGISQRGYLDITKQKKFDEVEIPVHALIAYTYQDRLLDWVGSSVLRSAYKPWVYKNELLELEKVILERNGMGIPVYEASENDDDELIDGQSLAESLSAGDSSGAAIPPGARLQMVGVTGQTRELRPVIESYDASIAKAVLAHALNLEGKGGSYALADVQMNLFIQSLETIADRIADVANQYLVEQMVYFYTGDADAVAPRIVFDEIGTNTHLTPDQIAALLNAKALQADKPLEEHIRRQGGLPAKQPIEDAAADAQKKRELFPAGVFDDNSPDTTTEGSGVDG